MLSHRLSKSLEDLAGRGIGMRPIFRVPLDTDNKSLGVLHRNGFYRSIFGHGFDFKLRGELVDGLAVNGIHTHAFFFQDFCKA